MTPEQQDLIDSFRLLQPASPRPKYGCPKYFGYDHWCYRLAACESPGCPLREGDTPES